MVPSTVANGDSKNKCWCCSFACREEIFSDASEEPEAVASTPAAQAAICSILGNISCPVFSPLNYSNGFAKLVQVQTLAVPITCYLVCQLLGGVNVF